MSQRLIEDAATRLRRTRDETLPAVADALLDDVRAKLKAVAKTTRGCDVDSAVVTEASRQIVAHTSAVSAEIAKALTAEMNALEKADPAPAAQRRGRDRFWWLRPFLAEEPPSPAKVGSSLGSPSQWPNPTLSAEQRARRIAAGRKRAQRVVGATTWKNAHLAGGRHVLTGALAERYPDGVEFSYEGFPIFEEYAEQIVVLPNGFGPSRVADAKYANEVCGQDKTPKGMVWHHKEDGRTMLLVDKELHESVGHWGGWRVYREALARREGGAA